MGITQYQKSRNLLTKIRETKGEVLAFPELMIELTKNVGSDRRTLSSYLKLMQDTKLISKEGENDIRINDIHN